MSYLFLGQDKSSKDAKISELKKKLFPTSEALEFDCETLYAHKLDPDTLQRSLLDLPAIAAQRLILIRECHKLSPHNRELIINFLKKKSDKVVLILDSDEMEPQDSFAQNVLPFVKMTDSFRPAQRSVFEMTKAIGAHNPAEALKIMGELFSAGIHPLQVMPAIVWFWGQSRNRLSKERFQEGLTLLQEADLHIKRSRLKPEQAIEVVVVKLSALV